jgi:hypothetical protein
VTLTRRPMTPAEKAKYMRERRARLVAEGLCISCACKPRLPAVQRCGECNERKIRYDASRRLAAGDVGPHGDAATLDEIAIAVGMTKSGVQRIIERTIQKLRRVYRRFGLEPSDIVGVRRSMLANAEDWGDDSWGDNQERGRELSQSRTKRSCCYVSP